MVASASTVGLGFVIISLGIIMLFICMRPIDSDFMKLSRDMYHAREIRRRLKYLRSHK
jgi:hypothetical protein